jgi:hypothetical protein
MIAFLAFLIALRAPAQDVTIHFDTSNADAFLDAVAGGSVERLAALPATQAVVAKRARLDPSVTIDTYLDTLRAALGKKPMTAHPFQWQFAIAQAPQMKVLIHDVREGQAAIGTRLTKALAPYLDPDARLAVTVHFIVGGVSAGWEDGAHDFYVGVPFYKGDVEGVVWTMQHELFHNVQAAAFAGQARDLERLNPREREVYRLLDELFREGTATYVADLAAFRDTPYIHEMRGPADANAGRMSDDFVLLDTLIYRLAHDDTSRFETLRSVGFDWGWQNPLYYAGAAMARALLANGGSLRAYVHERPTAFARDYVKLCAAKCAHPLSAGTAARIEALDERLAAAPLSR